MRETTSVAIALVLLVATAVVPVTAVAAMDGGDEDAVDGPDPNDNSSINDSESELTGNCIAVENGMACASNISIFQSQKTTEIP